jgi:hypothetical protein
MSHHDHPQPERRLDQIVQEIAAIMLNQYSLTLSEVRMVALRLVCLADPKPIKAKTVEIKNKREK